MDQLGPTWIDILTGHAAARFKWIDVRSASEWDKKPPRYPSVSHIPLQLLEARAPVDFSPDAELVVYGRDDAETAEAEELLARLGFKNVLAFHGGFDSVSRADLV